MRMTLVAGVIAVILAAQPGLVSADEEIFSGNAFLKHCKEALKNPDEEQVKAYSAGLCLGFTLAMWDMVEILGDSENVEICIPEGVSIEQLDRVFVKFMEEQPQDLHRRASWLFLVAAEGAFPCD